MPTEIKELVNKVGEIYSQQLKVSKNEGFHHPILHSSTLEMKELMIAFEVLTGKDWDESAGDYL